MKKSVGGSRGDACRSALFKLSWGARSVGVFTTGVGLIRFLSLRVLRPSTARVALRSGGVITFRYPSQLAPALVVFQDVIDPELRLLPYLLAPAATVMDIGAAIGQFTVIAGRVPDVTIHAYEPSSTNIASLERNIVLNHLEDRVFVHRVAVSSLEGQTSFHTSPNSFLSGMGADQGDVTVETVDVVTVSSELDRLGLAQLDILKVNVAGHEAGVIAGALDALRDGRVKSVIVLIGTAVVPLLEELTQWGFGCYFFDPFARVLHRLDHIDKATLGRPPTPARHVIAIHDSLVRDGNLRGIPIQWVSDAQV